MSADIFHNVSCSAKTLRYPSDIIIGETPLGLVQLSPTLGLPVILKWHLTTATKFSMICCYVMVSQLKNMMLFLPFMACEWGSRLPWCSTVSIVASSCAHVWFLFLWHGFTAREMWVPWYKNWTATSAHHPKEIISMKGEAHTLDTASAALSLCSAP